MKIDFLKEEEIVTESYFGICDESNDTVKMPAYVNTCDTNSSNWIAKVTNNSGKPIGFIAVDYNIEIRRENGDMENRCDALLHNDEYIIFIELKDKKDDWIKLAVEKQLLTTINIFKSCHDITKFRHRIAYVCNKKHPNFAVSNKEYMQRFKNEHNIRLIIGCNITIK